MSINKTNPRSIRLFWGWLSAKPRVVATVCKCTPKPEPRVMEAQLEPTKFHVEMKTKLAPEAYTRRFNSEWLRCERIM